MLAFGAVMDEPEDLMQLVLGITGQSVFDDLYANANAIPKESLSDWFDQKTHSFGGQDIIDTVTAIVGNSDKFDYQQVSPNLPNMDLPDVRHFFLSMLSLNKRRVTEENSELEFITPEEWRNEPGILPRYKGVVFNRKAGKTKTVMGIGHKIMNGAIEQAKNSRGSVAFLSSRLLDNALIVFKINNRITDKNIKIRKKIAGVSYNLKTQELILKKDSDILRILNEFSLKSKRSELPDSNVSDNEISDVLKNAKSFLSDNLKNLDLPFQYPNIDLLGVIWPDS